MMTQRRETIFNVAIVVTVFVTVVLLLEYVSMAYSSTPTPWEQYQRDPTAQQLMSNKVDFYVNQIGWTILPVPQQNNTIPPDTADDNTICCQQHNYRIP